MEVRCEKVLDDLLRNQEKLTKTELVKVFAILFNYIFPKQIQYDFNLEIQICTEYLNRKKGI